MRVVKNPKLHLSDNDKNCKGTSDNGAATDKLVFLVETMKKNFEGYTKWEVEGAIVMKHLQSMMGNPNQRDFEDMVYEKMIDSCKITEKTAKSKKHLLANYVKQM